MAAERRSFAFSTDLASLVAFDPKVLTHRIRHPSTWWRKPSVLDVDEVLEGRAAIWPIGSEGAYTVRLGLASEEPLSEEERALARGAVAGLGLVVESGEAFVGAAERLPGDGVGDRVVALPGTGALVHVPPGAYRAAVHVLDVRSDARFFDEDGERREGAPPDFVVLLESLVAPFDAPHEVRNLMDLLPRHEVPVVERPVVRAPSPPRESAAVRVRRVERAETPAASRPAPALPERLPVEPVPSVVAPLELPLAKRAMREVVRALSGRAPDPALRRGRLVLRPFDRALQSKEVALDDLLAKVTRCRDQLRVLEQRVNAHETLPDEAKLELDAAITRTYEALATLAEVAWA